MANFVYRLQSLLERREEALELAQRSLAASIGSLEEARATLQSLEDAAQSADRLAKSASASLASPSPEPIPGAEFLARVDLARTLHREASLAKDEALEQKIEVQEAEDRVEESRGSLAEAMRAVEVLKKHKQRAFEKFKQHEEEREASEMDEAGVALFNRRNA